MKTFVRKSLFTLHWCYSNLLVILHVYHEPVSQNILVKWILKYSENGQSPTASGFRMTLVSPLASLIHVLSTGALADLTLVEVDRATARIIGYGRALIVYCVPCMAMIRYVSSWFARKFQHVQLTRFCRACKPPHSGRSQRRLDDVAGRTGWLCPVPSTCFSFARSSASVTDGVVLAWMAPVSWAKAISLAHRGDGVYGLNVGNPFSSLFLGLSFALLSVSVSDWPLLVRIAPGFWAEELVIWFWPALRERRRRLRRRLRTMGWLMPRLRGT